VKFSPAQPAAFEPVPELHRIQLPFKFVHTPQTATTYFLTRRVERDGVELAQRVDLIPVRPNIAVLKRNMVRATQLPPLTTAALTDVKKALFDLADSHSMHGIPSDIAKEARESAKQVISGVFQNVPI
jgi:hypothetical protein